MNLKQFASIGILVTGLGFLGLESVDAKTPLQTSYTVAQTIKPSPIYETFKLTHSFDGIVYESVLKMEGHSGVMRTRYFNPITRKITVVRQTMKLDSTPQGLVIYGYNPVDDVTNKPISYSPDNYLISIRPDGSVFLHCDDQGQCSNVDVE
ncbi:hypothetical protein RIVM261_009370 [Rivularia sp. IAM M-261]|nr:hypothetical protein CAL7716_067980 [Calothrix sp. PCC 7716]GJD15981.1 hypothetical protein RIVM261_009370 [Rivularia sp. IAM M-261]